ncbi:carboxylic ester hydrolase [Parastagonospora nodorum]|nr:carboxylic ester hydrolase [Parastagonospora nodorum]
MRYLMLATRFAAACTATRLLAKCHGNVTTLPSLGGYLDSISATVVNASNKFNFCNVTAQYAHPGSNDTIHVYLYLPMENWNGRFLATGGGGYRMKTNDSDMMVNVEKGYAAMTTDGGNWRTSKSSESWALLGPGNINFELLTNYAGAVLEDCTSIGKTITTELYGKAPTFSYWNGCSTSGRQGLMLAQRFPKLYDGIMAASPAVNWAKLMVAMYWPHFVMNQLGVYPTPCEFDAIKAAALEACDALDGVKDGVISYPENFLFDPREVVGRPISCGNTSTVISDEAATIAYKTWLGPQTSQGSSLWYGLSLDTPLSEFVGDCSEQGCRGIPVFMASEWVRLWVKKGDPNFNITNMTYADYEAIFRYSSEAYGPIISTDNPDLSSFREAGGKMITWHGMADPQTIPEGTTDYYERVLRLDPKAPDFYRYFKAPGVWHCGGGPGPSPKTAFDALVAWVEEGVIPDELPASITTANIEKKTKLCPYPLVSVYKGGSSLQESSYVCEDRSSSNKRVCIF